MKQYRITSETFITPGETGLDDAVMDDSDLRELKKLAGLNEALAGLYTGNTPMVNTDPGKSMSPVGSNISNTAQQRNELLKKYNAQPGTDLWFIINFSLPYLNGSVEDKVKEYLAKHPEAKPRSLPSRH